MADSPQPDLSHLPETWVDERGVTLTRAGVQRFHARRLEAEARHDDAYWARLRARLGFDERTA